MDRVKGTNDTLKDTTGYIERLTKHNERHKDSTNTLKDITGYIERHK